jgi:hypothetical protein
MCANGTLESVMHWFWECPSAIHAWKWGSHILQCLLDTPSNQTRPICVNWKQGLFAYRTPRRFARISRIWLFMRSTIMWVLWKECLDATFNRVYNVLASGSALAKGLAWPCRL